MSHCGFRRIHPFGFNTERGEIREDLQPSLIALVPIYAALSASFVAVCADWDAIGDGLKPLTINQMPSNNSQMNSGPTMMLPTTELGSKTPNRMPTKRARSIGPAMSPSTAMARGTRADRYIR